MRSRGGFGSRAAAAADSHGRLVAVSLAPGQAHEAPLAPGLLDQLPNTPRGLVADRGYSSDAMREHVQSMGEQPAIPARRNQAPVHCPDWIYRHRNQIERLWGRLKEWRAVATRDEKLAASVMGVLCLAATMDWIKQ